MKEIPASRGIGLGAGLFVAAMVTASLIAILFLGWRVVGLPFAQQWRRNGVKSQHLTFR
jgi:hypothetical protein